MEFAVRTAAHAALALLFPPLLLGVIAKTKALFAGRVGPPVLQPYYDLAKLFRKGTVLSTTTTWVFLAGPVVSFVAVALGLLLIPFTEAGAPVSFTGDAILLAYLFGLARFFTASAALDTGSAFEGMGAAREVTFACLAEPAFFLGLVALAKLSGSLALSDMLGGSIGDRWIAAGASLMLVGLSWFIVLLAENSRIPFDDPNTHLELTMIHEVMVLDHSGPAFGMILYGAALKFFAYAALVVRLMVPVNTGVPWIDWPAFVGGVLVVAAAVGAIESTMARLRMTQVPVLLIAAGLLSAFAIVLLVR
jgi:formate hydrogenlyase subunit 4